MGEERNLEQHIKRENVSEMQTETAERGRSRASKKKKKKIQI